MREEAFGVLKILYQYYFFLKLRKSSASRYSRQVPQIAPAYRQRQFSILCQNSHCLSMEEN